MGGAPTGTRSDVREARGTPRLVPCLDGTVVHARSRAVARALRALGGAWGIVGALLERVPRSLADAACDAVARRRATRSGASCTLAVKASRLLP